MSVEIRRVPLDFDAPLFETWAGYLMPDQLRLPDCPDCRWGSRLYGEPNATGLTAAAYAIYGTFYPHMIGSGDVAHDQQLAWHDKLGQQEVDYLLAQGRLRTWVADDSERGGSWKALPLTAAVVNARQRGGLFDGHDAINRLELVRNRCQRLGIDYTCPTCGGTAQVEAYPGQRAEEEAWERTEPPAGDGWQVWETVSEGGPVSQVFKSRDELVSWFTNPLGWGINRWSHAGPLTRAQAEALVGAGASVGSGMFLDGEHFDGERAVAELQDRRGV